MLFFGIYTLASTPPVFAVGDAFLPQLVQLLATRNLQPHLLVFPTWDKSTLFRAIGERLRFWRNVRFPVTWMCSTPEEVKAFKSVGFSAIECHHNLFCDECTFKVGPSERTFDAVYNAVLRPYKRHNLASEVKSLRLVTGSVDGRSRLNELGVAHAVVNDRFLTKSEVNDVFGMSNCGLALSAEEGGMLAATEYLLAGLPIVTTYSRGGRHMWYTKENHRLVGADKNEIARAVQAFCYEGCDRESIRRQAVARSRHYRTTLSEVVKKITGTMSFDPAQITGRWFLENFVPVQSLPDFLESFDGVAFIRNELRGKFA